MDYPNQINPVFAALSGRTDSCPFLWSVRLAIDTLELHKKPPSTDRYGNNMIKMVEGVAGVVESQASRGTWSLGSLARR